MESNSMPDHGGGLSGRTLSVVIVSWNTREMLAECLGNLPAAAADLELETIVVDNGSTDGTLWMLKDSFPDVTLIENDENMGFAFATNQGITASSGEYVALVNSDIMVPGGSLDMIVDYLRKSPGVGAAGPQLVGKAGHLQYSGGYAPSPVSAFNQLVGMQAVLGGRSKGLFVRSRSQDRPMDVDWIGGACMVLRREAIDRVGMLDDEHFMYAEDVEYGVRLRRGGWRLQLLPWIRVLHYGGASSSGIPEARLLWLGGLFRVAAGQLRRPWFNIFGLLMSAAYFLRFILVAVARLTPVMRGGINPEVADNKSMKLYAGTAFKLGMRDPEYAIRYSNRLEERCRSARRYDNAEPENGRRKKGP